MISILGDSGLSVFHAGHWLWQRPHSVHVVKSSKPFHVKSSDLPTPSVEPSSISSTASTENGFPSTMSGLTAPSATGRRPKSTFSGAMKMCRCLEWSTKMRNTSMTPMCRISPMCSRRRAVSSPTGSSAEPTACEANAAPPYGKLPVTTPAPRKRNIVQMTLKIMNSVSHAPPRCEPSKRERRPSLAGEFRSRITAKTMMPSSAMTAMKSWRKPSTPQVPTTGMAKPSWKSEP
jgi:hypothetical protein